MLRSDGSANWPSAFFQRHGRQPLLLDAVVRDVADAASLAQQRLGHAVGAFGGRHRAVPTHLFAGFALPRWRGGGQVAGEGLGGAGFVGAHQPRDGQRRQTQRRVERGDARIVPLLDLAAEDVGQRGPVKPQGAAGHARQVDHRHDGADHGRNLDQLRFGQRVGVQRRVGAAEIHAAGPRLLDAVARAGGGVAQRHAALAGIGRGPLLVDQRWKTRAGALDGRLCVLGRAAQRKNDGHGADQRLPA